VVLPVGDQAAEQVGAAQDRAVRRCGAADGEVVAAARAGMAAVEGEGLGAEERLANPTTRGKAELFDLLELDLVRVDAYKFEGTASIPIPADGGEIWPKVPLRPAPHPPRSSPAASPA